MAYDELTAERMRSALAGRPGVVETRLMGGVCFMVNGNMCCTVSARGGILVRVGPEGYEQALAQPHAQPMEMRGRVMNGFVRVMPDGYRTDAALNRWIARGLDFVATLPPKKGRSPPRAATAGRRKKAK
ncbi:MAG TPA: TfoX/Sxy family protein [Xanthobacteraceae bacterium]|nr:TfoX/Sxy family protein [Xanthobacteraceae bacterium]